MVLSVEQAIETVLNNVEILGEEEKPLLDCLGQVLAEDVYSDINVPPLDNSAMDGYAIIAKDAVGASQDTPVILKVNEIIQAGSLPGIKVEPGTATRIMTGAPIPEGADCVIRFEDTDEENRKATSSGKNPAEIGILIEMKIGSNVRRAGESVSRGALIMKKGTVIRPSEIGLLASIGRNRARVIRRPVVAILATGNEVVDINQPLPEGKIYDSNSYSIAAQVQRYGGIPQLTGIAVDNEEDLIDSIQKNSDADILVTIGGVSMGDYDLIREVIARQGELIFWKVRTKPGKPLTFGKIMIKGKDGREKKVLHFGLAGNAVSCMVNFEIFTRPAMLKMMGRKNLSKPTIEAILEDSVHDGDGRRTFARVIVEKRDAKYFARLTGDQGSGILASMTLANGLAIIPETRPKIEKSEKVQVMMLDWSEEL
jgi:molybdopterin molybdotransferase